MEVTHMTMEFPSGICSYTTYPELNSKLREASFSEPVTNAPKIRTTSTFYHLGLHKPLCKRFE